MRMTRKSAYIALSTVSGMSARSQYLLTSIISAASGVYCTDITSDIFLALCKFQSIFTYYVMHPVKMVGQESPNLI